MKKIKIQFCAYLKASTVLTTADQLVIHNFIRSLLNIIL